jgi:catechol 2,3-dioxygenase-like lactoylglutathione lyase family enzyme
MVSPVAVSQDAVLSGLLAKSRDSRDGAFRVGEQRGVRNMQQQISVITLGIADLARSRRFYAEGFGWKPVFENPEIIFYQMNGLMLGTWLASALEADSRRRHAAGPGAFSLAHNVVTREAVQPTLDRLVSFGGTQLLAADAPPHGGFRGYVADPDGHAWEIAWNPAWPISPEGYVTFGT